VYREYDIYLDWECSRNVWSYKAEQKWVGENFIMTGFIVCTHQIYCEVGNNTMRRGTWHAWENKEIRTGF
jgi:hypothetical protein